MTVTAIAAAASLIAFAALGAISARRVRSASDFTVAGRGAGALAVMGVVLGTAVAGASTIGTAQAAYGRGLVGMWYTVGSGLGLAVLGLFFAVPMRRTGLATLPAFIEQRCGEGTAVVSVVGGVIGSLLSITSQFIAGRALLVQLFPISDAAASALLAGMILMFIFTGGVKSFSAVGRAKTVMLFVMLASCAAAAACSGAGPLEVVRGMSDEWLDPFRDGAAPAASSCAAMVTGIMCTQIYIQAVFSARDERTARRSCLASAVIVPLMGLTCVMIGGSLLLQGVELDSARALPHFATQSFPPAIGGVFWSVLAVAIIGGASGLALGTATNISFDVVRRIARGIDERRMLSIERASVAGIVLAAALAGVALRGSYILHLSYMAIGLRAAGMFVPFVAAVLRPGLLSHRASCASSVAGLAAMLIAWAALPSTEPLFVGLGASALAAIAVCAAERATRGD